MPGDGKLEIVSHLQIPFAVRCWVARELWNYNHELLTPTHTTKPTPGRIMARFSAFAILAIFTSTATAFVTPFAGAQLTRRAACANVATTRMSASPAPVAAPPTVRERERERERTAKSLEADSLER